MPSNLVFGGIGVLILTSHRPHATFTLFLPTLTLFMAQRWCACDTSHRPGALIFRAATPFQKLGVQFFEFFLRQIGVSLLRHKVLRIMQPWAGCSGCKRYPHHCSHDLHPELLRRKRRPAQVRQIQTVYQSNKSWGLVSVTYFGASDGNKKEN